MTTGIVTVGTYNVSRIYLNSTKRDGTPCKPYYKVVFADGGSFPCWDHAALAHLIASNETQKVYEPPVAAEIYIEARPLPGGPRIVRRPAPVAAPTLVAPGQTQVAPAPQPVQQTVKYEDDPLAHAVHGTAEAAAAAAIEAKVLPAVSVKPPVKTGDTPPPASDLREREFSFRQAAEITKNRQIARIGAWNRVVDMLNTSAISLDEKLGRVRDGKLTPVVEIIYGDILSADAPFDPIDPKDPDEHGDEA